MVSEKHLDTGLVYKWHTKTGLGVHASGISPTYRVGCKSVKSLPEELDLFVARFEFFWR